MGERTQPQVILPPQVSDKRSAKQRENQKSTQVAENPYRGHKDKEGAKGEKDEQQEDGADNQLVAPPRLPQPVELAAVRLGQTAG